MAVLRLKSSDGHFFEVEETVIMQSITLKGIVEDGFAGDEIPLCLVDGQTLAKVLEWCKQHEHATSNKTEEEHKKTKEEVEEWEKSFVTSLDVDDLYDLLLASNYLNIPALLDCVVQQVADMIKGKTPAEIRRIFNIENDFTPEEEKEIMEENSWAFT